MGWKGKFKRVGPLLLTWVQFSAAGEMEISRLFPSLTNIDTDSPTPLDRTSSEYGHLRTCALSTHPATACDPSRKERFFNLALTDGVQDSPDQVNRCIGLRAGRVSLLGAIRIDPARKTVRCDPEPEAIAFAHLVLCYERVTGARCSLATVCFEGKGAKGRCTRNYEGIEIRLPST